MLLFKSSYFDKIRQYFTITNKRNIEFKNFCSSYSLVWLCLRITKAPQLSVNNDLQLLQMVNLSCRISYSTLSNNGIISLTDNKNTRYDYSPTPTNSTCILYRPTALHQFLSVGRHRNPFFPPHICNLQLCNPYCHERCLMYLTYCSENGTAFKAHIK
jgi:hypothetical protein